MTLEPMLLEPVEGSPIKGFLSYERSDHAFAFRPSDPQQVREMLTEGRTSLAFGTIQLEVAVSTGRCLFAWGYSPRQGWVEADLSNLPKAMGGACSLIADLEDGISQRVSETNPEVLFDRSSNRTALLVDGHAPAWSIEIAEGVSVLGTEDGVIAGLVFEPMDRDDGGSESDG